MMNAKAIGHLIKKIIVLNQVFNSKNNFSISTLIARIGKLESNVTTPTNEQTSETLG